MRFNGWGSSGWEETLRSGWSRSCPTLLASGLGPRGSLCLGLSVWFMWGLKADRQADWRMGWSLLLSAHGKGKGAVLRSGEVRWQLRSGEVSGGS